MEKLKVLMVGPARNVKGGMTTVVDQYYEYGLDKAVDLKYIETVNDKNSVCKFLKMIVGYIKFRLNIKKYDVVHIHMASRLSTFRKAKYVKIAKKYNKRIIVHIHGAEYRKFYSECNDSKKEYICKTLKLADKIIVLSEEWKEFFSELVDSSKIEIIYNAVVVPKDFSKDVNTLKFLFLGRLGHRKGIYDLIELIDRLRKKYRDIQLYVGGDGEVDKVKKIIKEKQLDENIHYIGWISGNEKEKFLKECSFYILPSYNEGMPMSLIEGMAYKNIAISTNVGGIPQVIQNEENGIIVEPGDIEKMKLYIEKILSDEKMRIKLSINARNTVEEKFNINRNIQKLLNLYK